MICIRIATESPDSRSPQGRQRPDTAISAVRDQASPAPSLPQPAYLCATLRPAIWHYRPSPESFGKSRTTISCQRIFADIPHRCRYMTLAPGSGHYSLIRHRAGIPRRINPAATQTTARRNRPENEELLARPLGGKPSRTQRGHIDSRRRRQCMFNARRGNQLRS